MQKKVTLVVMDGEDYRKSDIYMIEAVENDNEILLKFMENAGQEFQSHLRLPTNGLKFIIYENWNDLDVTNLLESDESVMFTNIIEKDLKEEVEGILLESTCENFDGMIDAINSLERTMIKNTDRLIKSIQGLNPNV